MSEKKLSYDFWNTPEGIRSQKIFDMMDRIRRLEASNAELLAALEDAKKFIEEHLPFVRHCTVDDYMSIVNKVMTPIEAAISKAKGD